MILGIAIRSTGSYVESIKTSRAFGFFSFLFIPVIFVCFYDYVRIGEASVAFRMRYNDIGLDADAPKIPKYILLDQANELMIASYIKPATDGGGPDVKIYQKASLRFGTQRILYDAAMALYLDKQRNKAEYMIYTICRINSEAMCIATKQQWSDWKGK